MSLLERLDRKIKDLSDEVSESVKRRRFDGEADDTRQLLEDAAKEIRARSKGFGQYVEDRAKRK